MTPQPLAFAALIAAVLIAAPGATSADPLAPGAIQLSHQLGVEPGRLSVVDLIRLRAAREDRETVTVKRLERKAGMGRVTRGPSGIAADRPRGLVKLGPLLGLSGRF